MNVKLNRIILVLIAIAVAIATAACGRPIPMTWAG